MKYYYQKSLEKILENINGRKIILYGTDLLSETIYYNLINMGIQIQYFVSDSEEVKFCGKEVKSPYDLLYESKEEIYIIAFVLKDQKEIYQMLVDMQFVFERDFCIYGLGGYIAKYEVVDSLLGFSRKYDEVPGFKVYGNQENKNALKILTLGGSTSDPTLGNFASWPEQLYYKISKDRDVVLYSGGMGGYSVHQEFLKFIRDGLVLQPDILITYDGYNDVGFQVSCEEHPLLHRYQKRFYDFIEEKEPMAPDTLDMRNVKQIAHGIPHKKSSDVQNWVDGVRKIHAIADEFGIQYFGFFQPMIPSGKAVIDESVNKLAEAYFAAYPRVKDIFGRIPEFVKGCQKQIKDISYITDLSDVLDGCEDVYYDICHSTDKGNNIITEHIYNKIEDAVKKHRR